MTNLKWFSYLIFDNWTFTPIFSELEPTQNLAKGQESSVELKSKK